MHVRHLGDDACGIPEVPGLAADVELSRGKGAVSVLVDSGPADFVVVPAVDPIAHMEVLELPSGNGGETVVADDTAVSFRRADEDDVRRLVGPAVSGADNAVFVDPAVEVERWPVPVTRVPVDADAEVVLVRGNGAELVLAVSTLVDKDVNLLVVKITDVLIAVDTDSIVCKLSPIVDVVLFRAVEELEVADVVTFGVKIDRGNVLRVDIWEVVLA